jgi:hypothetical protein
MARLEPVRWSRLLLPVPESVRVLMKKIRDCSIPILQSLNQQIFKTNLIYFLLFNKENGNGLDKLERNNYKQNIKVLIFYLNFMHYIV